MISRRSFAALLAALPLSSGVRGQQKLRRVGILLPGTAESEAWRVDAFKQGLRDHGYVEGKNVAIEIRFGEDQPGRLPQLAAQLAASRVDVIFAGAINATVASKQHAPGIPVVFMGVSNPVELGLVASLARPGGMLTGLTPISIELAAKNQLPMIASSGRIAEVGALISYAHCCSRRQPGLSPRSDSLD